MATLGATGSIWLHVFEGVCTDHTDYVWIPEERAYTIDVKRKVLSYFDRAKKNLMRIKVKPRMANYNCRSNCKKNLAS